MKYHNSFLAIPLFLFSASAMSAVTPKITKISVTPTSAPAGTMFKFSAEINNPLPEGYKVKIAPIGLTGFTTMIRDAKNGYALSRAIYTTGKQKYKVVIVNAKNVAQGISKIGTYTVLRAAVSNKAPTLSLVKAENTATTITAYTVTFNAKDIDANLSSITMNWGDNSEPETLTVTDSKDLTFSHIYTSASSFGWNAFASDKGSPVLNSKSISKIVTVSNPEPVEVIALPAKTTGYTKIANDGSELPDSATLGTNPKDWACTKDNKTGLIWEVKGNDGITRDKNWWYTWSDNVADCKGVENCTTYVHGYTKSINNTAYCGGTNWRIPSISELKSLVYCLSENNATINATQYGLMCLDSPSSPTINTDYFPNTIEGIYWSSSPYPQINNSAWYIDFKSSMVEVDYKTKYAYLRLVRDNKPTPTLMQSMRDLEAAKVRLANALKNYSF